MSKDGRKKQRMNIHYYNVNPHGNKTGDCTIRAIAYASNQPYEKVARELFELGLEHGYAYNDRQNLCDYLKQIGFTKQPQPRKSNNTKFRVNEIDKVVDTNKYDVVVNVAHHFTAVDGNEIIDIWDCGRKCIGYYFTRLKVKGAKKPKNCIKKKDDKGIRPSK